MKINREIRLVGCNIKPEHINALGRCLDAFYEKGVSCIFQNLSECVVKHLRLKCDSVHLDSTSFHLDGEYNHQDDFQEMHITKG